MTDRTQLTNSIQQELDKGNLVLVLTSEGMTAHIPADCETPHVMFGRAFVELCQLDGFQQQVWNLYQETMK